MAMFQYMAKNLGGQPLRGEIVATSSQEAIQLLRRQDMFVTRLTEKTGVAFDASQWNFSWRKPRVTNKELVLFTHQFATLIRAGVPLLECLDILGTEVDNLAWQPIVGRIRSDVEQGALLAQALGHFPTIFHDFYRRMVEVGETTGRLDESLSQLAVYLDKQALLRAKIVSALAYPALLVTVAMTVFVFLLIWVVPLFSGLFQEFGESLPWLTQMVIDLSNGLRKHAFHTGQQEEPSVYGWNTFTSALNRGNFSKIGDRAICSNLGVFGSPRSAAVIGIVGSCNGDG
jgi:type IV pilus assembly protein PilC